MRAIVYYTKYHNISQQEKSQKVVQMFSSVDVVWLLFVSVFDDIIFRPEKENHGELYETELKITETPLISIQIIDMKFL